MCNILVTLRTFSPLAPYKKGHEYSWGWGVTSLNPYSVGPILLVTPSGRSVLLLIILLGLTKLYLALAMVQTALIWAST